MKMIIRLLAIILTIASMTGCNTVGVDKPDLNSMDDFPANKYYSSDSMPEKYQKAYGNWMVTSTSGGLTGKGFKQDFDYLILKKNSIFGVIRNDSLIAYGKMVLSKDEIGLLCTFNSEKSTKIEICMDNEKYIELVGNDTLNLNAPCCDRYNIQLIRQK